MRYDENGACYIAESKEDFKGWEYMGKKKHKEGVWVVGIRNTTGPPTVFKQVFTSEEHLPNVDKSGICI